MTQDDFEDIDQLLRGERHAGAEDALYIALMTAAPQPDIAFIYSLEDQLNQVRPEKITMRIPKVIRQVAAFSAACLLVVGTVFAVDELLNQVLDSDAGLRAVREEGKGIELDLSAEVGQFTVEIQWGYADTQRISLAYVISAHDAQTYTNMGIVDAVLTLADGSALPMSPSGVQLFENNQTATRLETNVGNRVLPDILDADLSFRLAYAHDAHRTAVPLPAFGNSTMRLEDWMLHTEPVMIELSLPVEQGGYTLPLDLVAEDAGIEMNLREFQAAPSLGLAIICFALPQRPQEEMWEWGPSDIALEYNGELIIERAGGRNRDGCSEIPFTEGLPTAPGTWTLTVRTVDGTRTYLPEGPEWVATVTAAGGTIYEMEGGMGGISLPAGADEAIGMRERITGEWVFTFSAP